MVREIQPPERHDGGGRYSDYTETHPAYGVAVVTRGQGTPRTLFQSDLQHNETITLTIQHAERSRSLIQDWVFPRKAVVEVEMSLAQWGALVSSVGLGSGVPVTIRATESDHMVPGLTYEPRIAEAVAESKGTVQRIMASIRENYDEFRQAFDSKTGIKDQREKLNSLHWAIHNTEANAEFSIKQVADAVESVVAQGKADIEMHILRAQQITGAQVSIEVPDLGQQRSIEED